MINPWKNVSICWLIFWLIFGRFLGGFRDAFWLSKSMKNASKNWWKKWLIFACFFDWKCLPNGRPGRLKKELKREPKWDTLPGPLQGRVWGGFWMDLGSILGGFWRDLGAPGESKWTWKSIQVEGNSGPAPRIPQGRLWGGFWEGLGRFGEGFGRVLEGFYGDFSLN